LFTSRVCVLAPTKYTAHPKGWSVITTDADSHSACLPP